MAKVQELETIICSYVMSKLEISPLIPVKEIPLEKRKMMINTIKYAMKRIKQELPNIVINKDFDDILLEYVQWNSDDTVTCLRIFSDIKTLENHELSR